MTACSCSHDHAEHLPRGCRRCGCDGFTPATTCQYCGTNPAWANDRYFSMLDERDVWQRRYYKCGSRLHRTRWLTGVLVVAALAGWLR